MPNGKIPFDMLLFNFFREITDADIAIQLNQLEAWREAAKQYPYLNSEDAVPSTGQGGGEVRQVISDLMEGVDRQNNLAIGEVTLEFSLEKTRTPFFQWLRALFTPKKKRVYYRLAPSSVGTSGKSRLKLTLKARRKPVGAWEVSAQTERYPEELAHTIVPRII
ncbi:MAG: hypothetical protein HGJ94_03445 [Desulfosarcina sp.]|nr:hypothetical protein [Desulfosarcina sp.]MBC2742412.1 hypothetical protein [Desulfosarcina sp.]MBC2765322.1 hypothetical protein [Desulfosarcina sp.]